MQPTNKAKLPGPLWCRQSSLEEYYAEIVSGGNVPVPVTVKAWLLVFGGGVGLTWVSLGLAFVSVGLLKLLPLFELGGGGGATELKLLTVLALRLGTEKDPVKLGWLKVPVCDSCEKVGLGSVVKDPENDEKVPVNVGLLKEPVKLDS